MSDNFKETQEYSKIVMPEIIDILDNEGIEYEQNTDNTEIVIQLDDKNTEDSIEKLITDNTSVPKTIFVILIRLIVVDDKLYIRQTTI